MANQFLANRHAFGTVSFPANVLASSESVLSATVPGVFIPTGAIINDIKYMPVGALTGFSAETGTMNIAVSTQVIGTADANASAALLAGSVYNHTVVAAGIGASPLISTGGPLVMQFAGGNANRSVASANFGVYVGYLASM